MAVYFMQAGEGGPVKIGFSHDPRVRRRSLQTALPWELIMLAVRPNATIEDEKALHGQFRHCRIRGEWFRPEYDLLIEVEKYRLGKSVFFVDGEYRSEPRPIPKIAFLNKGAAETRQGLGSANCDLCFGIGFYDGDWEGQDFDGDCPVCVGA